MQGLFGFSSYQIVFRPVVDIWFYLLAAAVLEALALYSWRYRSIPAALTLACSFTGQAVWLVSLVLITVSPNSAEKCFYVKLQQLSAIICSYLFPALILQLSNQQPRFIRRVATGLLAAMLFSSLALLSNDWHGLFWRSVIWDGQSFSVLPGPLLETARGFGVLAMLTGYFLGIRWTIASAGLRRWQAGALMLGPLFALVGYVAWISGENMPLFPPLPAGFLLSGVLWGWAFWWLRVFNLIPLAQATVTRNMDDALIVLDDSDYIIELNPAARKRFGNSVAEPAGKKYQDFFASWPQLRERIAAGQEIQSERLCRDHADGRNHYQLHLAWLRSWHGRIIGRAIVLRDITPHVQAEKQLLEQQKALAILTERSRLGRELHDGVGQLWSFVNMQVEAIRSLLAKQDIPQAERLLLRLSAVTQDAHADIRDSITGLQTAVSDEQGLWQALDNYLQWFRQNYDIDSDLIIDSHFSAGLISPVVEVQLLRIIQEALTNVRKHALARHIKVIVRIQENCAEIRIEDDGKGFDLAKTTENKGHYGLKIMQERAAELGALFSIESTPEGTTVIVKTPLRSHEGGAA